MECAECLAGVIRAYLKFLLRLHRDAEDILDLVKMERGKVQLAMEDVRLVDCMREILATFVHPAQTKRLQMELEVHGSCPEAVHTDRVRFRQIVLNLLSNAVKFTPPGGTVTVRVVSRRVDVVSPARTEDEYPVRQASSLSLVAHGSFVDCVVRVVCVCRVYVLSWIGRRRW
jgi:signal transduction histidine kinase